MLPAISIIIPAHNEEKYIEKTLESVKNQTVQNFEVVIVTNGCTDQTENIVKKHNSDKIRHLSLPKPNVSVARNAGALNAQGKLLLFLDADTQLAPDALKKIQEQFIAECSVASTKSKPDLPKLSFKLIHLLKNFYLKTSIYQGCSGALICRKEDFQKANGYNPEITVREHRKLILKLKKLGDFSLIDTTVTTSARRFEQWGITKTSFFWAGQWLKDKFGDLKTSQYEKVR